MTSVILLTRNWSSWPDFAGSTWVPMQYLLGFMRLGVEAYWLDYLDRFDPLEKTHSLDYLVGRLATTAADFGFSNRYGLVFDNGGRYFGLSEERLQQLLSEADLLLSISGNGLPEEPRLKAIERRAYLDVDPGFTQIWASQFDMNLDHFNYFFTIGQTIGRPECRVPTLGLDWQVTVPPVVLDLWPGRSDPYCRRYSTIGDWWGDQKASYEGEYYGGKRDEFLKIIRLPLETKQRFEIALTIYQIDHEEIGLLHQNEWILLDPFLYAGDPHSYREFIQFSRAEFSVAKGGYVKAQPGWISDRSVCYLASGKPVLVQSTGFEPYVPAAQGLLTFTTLEEAIAGIKAIEADYLAHSQAARDLAETYFNSDIVLTALLEQAGL